jgi:Rieske 2Fe-2S family protein
VCELTQKGVRTRGYVPGRYSAEEIDVHAFDVMVAERYMEALREGQAVPA